MYLSLISQLLKPYCTVDEINLHFEILVIKCLPHQRELYMHLSHDRFFGFRYCNDPVLVQYGMQLSHAFPKAMAVSPLQ